MLSLLYYFRFLYSTYHKFQSEFFSLESFFLSILDDLLYLYKYLVMFLTNGNYISLISLFFLSLILLFLIFYNCGCQAIFYIQLVEKFEFSLIIYQSRKIFVVLLLMLIISYN